MNKLDNTGNESISRESSHNLGKSISPDALLSGVHLSEKVKSKVGKIADSVRKGVAIALVASSVLTHQESQAADSLIRERWESTAEYKKYLELGGENSPEARKLMEETIKRIVNEILTPYFQEIEPKFRDSVIEDTEKLPLRLQALLADMYLNLRGFLDPSRSAKDITRFNIFMYQYVESILYYKGISERKVMDMIKFFPEIDGKKMTKDLLRLGKSVDELARLKKENREREARIAEWKKLIEKLEALEKAIK